MMLASAAAALWQTRCAKTPKALGFALARGIAFCLEPLAMICPSSAHFEAEPNA
jgi:hypothetical protein